MLWSRLLSETPFTLMSLPASPSAGACTEEEEEEEATTLLLSPASTNADEIIAESSPTKNPWAGYSGPKETRYIIISTYFPCFIECIRHF